MGPRQRLVWVGAGLSAAVTAEGCGLGWPWVLTGGLAGILLYIVCIRTRPCGAATVLRMKAPPVAWLAALWTVFAMGWTAILADSAFPMTDGFPALGWILLLLAAFGAEKGVTACAGTAGVLCLFLAGLYGAVTGFAAPDVATEYLRPDRNWQNILPAMGLFLLPTPILMLKCRAARPLAAEGKCSRGGQGSGRPTALCGWCVFLPLIAAILTAVTAGVLSPQLAAQSENAFYDLARSVSILGVMERVEPLVSAAMTMGVFCLLTGQLCAVKALIPGKYTVPLAVGAAALAMIPAKLLSLPLLAAGNILFWVLPILLCHGRAGACSHRQSGEVSKTPTDSAQNTHSPQGVESVKKDKK